MNAVQSPCIRCPHTSAATIHRQISPCDARCTHALKAWVLLALALCTCCGPITDMRERFNPDLIPPLLLHVRAIDRGQLELTFDEPPRSRLQDLAIDPPLDVCALQSEDCRLLLQTAAQSPGAAYQLEAVVEDEAGNGLHFLAEFYGFNGEVPALVINEFTTRGTGNHPDVVELRVLKGGNMGGVVLYEGTPANHDERIVFPAFAVAPGSFLIVHFKPQGVPLEIDETDRLDQSGGLDSSDRAFDFWIPEGGGISGNNGVISLYAQPGGPIMDGVLYSDRTSDSDERYGGFGTADAWERARQLVDEGGWMMAGQVVRPEDAVSPEGSTGTRSICRSADSMDSDSDADWHIVPTLGFTFGQVNSEEVYSP